MKIMVWTSLLGVLSLPVMVSAQSASDAPVHCQSKEDLGDPFTPVEFKVVGQGQLYFYSAPFPLTLRSY